MLIKLVLQFCRKQYAMKLLFILSCWLPQIINKRDREKITFSLVIYLCQSSLFFLGIHCLCKTNLAWLASVMLCAWWRKAIKKVPCRERYLVTWKEKFTRPCCQAPKAYIGMFVTIARKVLTAKIQYFSFGLTNRVYFAQGEFTPYKKL